MFSLQSKNNKSAFLSWKFILSQTLEYDPERTSVMSGVLISTNLALRLMIPCQLECWDNEMPTNHMEQKLSSSLYRNYSMASKADIYCVESLC